MKKWRIKGMKLDGTICGKGLRFNTKEQALAALDKLLMGEKDEKN